MNCPACLSIMTCKSEIHKISPTKNRMDLCCWNMNCISRNIYIKNDTTKHIYVPFVQVITNDPLPWECIAYGFIIVKNNKIILITGDCKYNFTTSKMINGSDSFLFGYRDAQIKWEEIRKTEYVQLSSGNDMHLQVNKLSDKLTKLIAFI